MKKLFAVILTGAVLCMSLTACTLGSKKDKDEDKTVGGMDYEDIKSEQLTEKAWESALSADSFSNCSMTGKIDTNGVSQSTVDAVNAIGTAIKVANGEMWIRAIEYSDTIVNPVESYFIRDESGYLQSVLLDGKTWSEWESVPYSPIDALMQFFGAFQKNYSLFTYDSANGVYQAHNFELGGAGNLMDIGLKFSGGKLAGFSMRYQDEDIAIYMVQSGVIYDYGKTVLTRPTTGSGGGGSIPDLPDPSDEWAAALSEKNFNNYTAADMKMPLSGEGAIHSTMNRSGDRYLYVTDDTSTPIQQMYIVYDGKGTSAIYIPRSDGAVYAGTMNGRVDAELVGFVTEMAGRKSEFTLDEDSGIYVAEGIFSDHVDGGKTKIERAEIRIEGNQLVSLKLVLPDRIQSTEFSDYGTTQVPTFNITGTSEPDDPETPDKPNKPNLPDEPQDPDEPDDPDVSKVDEQAWTKAFDLSAMRNVTVSCAAELNGKGITYDFQIADDRCFAHAEIFGGEENSGDAFVFYDDAGEFRCYFREGEEDWTEDSNEYYRIDEFIERNVAERFFLSVLQTEYAQFEYNGSTYSATLFLESAIGSADVPITFEVIFKDGHITHLAFYNDTTKFEVRFSDYGTTEVSVPDISGVSDIGTSASF